MFIKKLRALISCLAGERGVLVVPFAILLPILIALLSLGINSAAGLASKARMADAASEASLAVSASSLVNDNRTAEGREEIAAAKVLVTAWMKYYFPAMKGSPQIAFTVDQDLNQASSDIRYTYYNVAVSLDLPYLFSYKTVTGNSHDYTLSAGQGHVKKYISKPADYVFVVDFSASQAGAPMRMLKRVFYEITNYVVSASPESRIAIVPFSTGVVVKLPGKNVRGGANLGCSVLFVPKEEWKVNYAFWADKRTATTSAYQALNRQNYLMDEARYNYYKGYVAASSPAVGDTSMKAAWCRTNSSYGQKTGKYQYSCYDTRYPDDDIFSERSQEIIQREYLRAAKTQYKQLSTYTIEHDDAIDYPATLEKMFSDEAIITMPMPLTPLDGTYSWGYNHMCRQAGWWNSRTNNMVNRAPKAWLIPLTGDAGKLHEFQSMEPYGWTHLSTALVRSVPVMMEGTNRRKVFIMISDGYDNLHPQKVTDKYLKTYNLCRKIEEGLLARPQTRTSKVEFYYVSTNNAVSRVKYWADNCTGSARAKTATQSDSLIKLIKGIISDETGHLAVD
ncbi:VWA domain-containing protein [Tatumella sp. JGM118]|uniref:VWA domain-containing protein n=1 Tax=Tatumella sp. JGM118 TaxID=2799796 RepID=UPI001BAE88D7|nr:VWA domain-containing protein [Tatumella sp. JGM118]MBS0910222.1 VWA domain-containing protein [Tatumella sp. JGM118]